MRKLLEKNFHNASLPYLPYPINSFYNQNISNHPFMTAIMKNADPFLSGSPLKAPIVSSMLL